MTILQEKLKEEKLEEEIFCIVQTAYKFSREPKETTEKIMKVLKENK